MNSPLITLTTDFGEGSSYVAALKAVILSVNPAAHIVDLSHNIPPQNLIATAMFLGDVFPFFPAGAIHVVVVDPGVGTDRALLCVRWNEQILLVPDNGCWTRLEMFAASPVAVVRLTNDRFWRSVSATFHGRDILGPVAGHLSLGVPPKSLGEPVGHWRRLKFPIPSEFGDGVRGEIILVDRFGNLISNIMASEATSLIVSAGCELAIPGVRTYGGAEPGSLVALTGSSGWLEIAVVNGSAAERLGLKAGATVTVRRAR